MIETILVPTDGSAHARKATEFAGALAAKFGARVVLLHVLLHDHLAEGLESVSEIRRHFGQAEGGLAEIVGDIPAEKLAEWKSKTPDSEALRHALKYIADQVIDGATKAIKDKGVVDIRGHIADGDPAERILELAEKENADVIVMGSRGLDAVESLLLGSTSQEVSHRSPCTCITVK
jgi:nucleotide-binding universal stress UspA family protein